MGHPSAGKDVSTEVENIVLMRPQTETGKDTEDRRCNTCCIELQGVRISDTAIGTCSYCL